MKKLDLSLSVAKRVTTSDGCEWIMLSDDDAYKIYLSNVPIAMYKVYSDETEGLVESVYDFIPKRCDFYAVESAKELCKYVDIKVMSEEEIMQEIIKRGEEVYTKMALKIAIHGYTYNEFVGVILGITSDYTTMEDNYIEFVVCGVKMMVGKTMKGSVYLCNTFYLECEDGEWTEMGYNIYDNEFVWMDEKTSRHEI